MSTLLQDLRYAVRMLAKSPMTTAMAVVALALGIGGVTSTLSSVVCLVLRPYPFPESERIVSPQCADLKRGGGWNVVSSADYLAWRDENRSFERMAAYTWTSGNLGGVDEPERLRGSEVAPDLFPLLRVAPALGRAFLPEEEQPGHDDVVVLSYGLWQRRFEGSAAVLGRVISLDDRSHTVVGVMPREFEFPAGTEYWKPLAISASHRTWTTGRTWAVLARLRPGVSIGQADAEMNAIAARIATEHPDTNEAIGVRILRLGEMTNKPTSRFVLIGLGASLFVLLLACVNVSNLLLARATTRQHEVAVRAAMGANRVSIARLFVTEGLVLSAVGAVLGALLAAWGQRLTRAAIPAQAYRWVPGLRNLRIDGTVLAATAVIALASGLACGLVAAWRATRAKALTAGLAESGRGRVSGHGRLRQLLVVAEVALALVLLVACGVMVRTYSRMAAFDIGINPKNVVQMHLSLPSNRYPDAASVRSFYDRTLERIEAMPGVTAAAAGNVSGSVAMTDFQIVGQPPPPHGTMPPNLHLVTPGYFAAVGLPVLGGRGFSKEDEATGTTTVVVVSESVVRRYWKTSGDPLGAMVSRTGYAFPPLRVIGVVGDVKDSFSGSPQPTVYVLNSQMPQSYVQIFVRTAAEPTAMAARLRAEVQAVDRTLPVEDLKTMERNLWEQTSGVRISAAQMGVFAIIALLLATTGIYGVVAFSVAQRTREMGVRMALGASAQDVLRLIVGQSMRTTTIGLAIGCVAAFLLMQAMARALFDVVRLDASVFVGVTFGLALCAALAAYAPARRAAKVDPMVALRCE